MVRALCLAVQSGSLLPADAEGNPVYPLITWLDGRSAALWYNNGELHGMGNKRLNHTMAGPCTQHSAYPTLLGYANMMLVRLELPNAASFLSMIF